MNNLPSTVEHGLGAWSPPVSWFQSRAYWREVGRRLPHHPELLGAAEDYLTNTMQTGEHACSRKYLQRWQEVLHQGTEAVVAVLTSPDDEEGQVLRSCSPLPFMSLISDEERDRLYDQVRHAVRSSRHHETPST